MIMYSTRDSVSSKYPNIEKRIENTTRSGEFWGIPSVWIADETLSQLFDISSESKQLEGKVVKIDAN